MLEDITIDGYRRLGVLQTGQNSEVWEVTDGTRRYVMKLLLPEKVSVPGQRQMLFHEAQVGLKLQHPKIIRVIAFSRDRTNPYILMECFPCTNLKLRLLRGQFEEFIKPNLRKIIEQVGQALDYMHEKGWVHRDIKPDNLLVSTLGDLRLIDFALAVRTSTSFTRMFGRRGRTAGTRSYMSPEQIRGLPLDRRADIYSLGVTIFEAVSGRVPFVARSANELFQKHIGAEVPLINPERKVTPDFESVIRKMLSKKAQDRFENLTEFLNAARSVRLFQDEVVESARPAMQ